MSDFNYIAYQKEFETFKEDLHQQHVVFNDKTIGL